MSADPRLRGSTRAARERWATRVETNSYHATKEEKAEATGSSSKVQGKKGKKGKKGKGKK